MIAKADANGITTKVMDASGNVQAPEETAPVPAEKPALVRPEWIEEKFWKADDADPVVEGQKRQHQAYLEAQKAISKRGDDGKFAKKEDLAVTPDAEAQAAVAKVGLDFDALSNEIQTNGGLSEESYAKLAAGGYDKQRVDEYVEGRKAVGQLYNQAAYQIAGGTEQSFKAMAAWALTNLPQGEVQAFDKTVTTGNIDAMKMAVAGLYARYTAANGKNPQLEVGGNAVAAVGGTYASMEEMVSDMRDPRYKKDPAFQARVQAKADRSNF